MEKKILITIFAIIGVVLVAALFRFYDLQNYPPGLFPDEAANGEDALLILNGDLRPFYERGNGREALFFYLEALSITLFGIGVWQLHAVSAIIGVLTVLAMYFATRPFFGRMAGLLTAFFLATNHWHVTLSRTGFRAILIPLFVAAFTAAVGYMIRAVHPPQSPLNKGGRARGIASYVFAALAGAAFMGGFYTYIAYRVIVGVVLGVAVLLVLAAIHPKVRFLYFRRYGKYVLVGIIAGLIVFAPLGRYFIQHPDAFIGRAGQVSIFNKDLQDEFGGGTLLGTLAFSTRQTLLSFFSGSGDLNWRHNVAGFPLLNLLIGALFLIGLVWAVHGTVVVGRKVVQGKKVHLGMIYPYLLLMLLGMLLPIISTAEGIPHGLRSIGLVVPIFMLAGAAGAVCIHWVQTRVTSEPLKATAYGLIGGILLLSMLYDGALYFLIARNSSEAAYEYRADLTDVAAFINAYAQENGPFDSAPTSAKATAGKQGKPYLVLDKFSLQTIHFLTSVQAHDYLDHPDEHLHKYEDIDPATSHRISPERDRLIIFTQSTIFDADRYEQAHRDEIELVESRVNRFNEEIMRVYRGKVIGDGEVPDGQTQFDLDA